MTADARLLSGDVEGATEAAAKAPPAARAYADRIAARAAAAQGRVAEAQAMLVALVDANPRDAAAWTDLGRIRLTAGEVGGAAEAAANAARLAPTDPIALTLQGEVIRTRYGLAAAMPWFDRALATDAYFPPALIEAAATAGDLGRHAEMLSLTRRALAARPGDPRALYLQAVLAARGGEDALAGQLLRAGGGALANLPGARLLDALLDHRRGQYQQAAAKWGDLVADQPLNIGLRRLYAAALLRSGDPRAALDTIRPLALRADAGAYALDLTARGFAAVGATGPAAAAIDRAALPAGPASVFASDAAIGALRAGARAAPTDPSYALGIIRGQLTGGDTGGAIATATTLAAATPGAPPAQTARGDALAAAGRWPDAVAAYARAASLRFDEPAMLRLVSAQERSRRPTEAAATLALYLQQNPQSIAGRRLLGAWQSERGEDAAAIETLEGVRRTIGNRDADLMASLALAYASQDDGEIARRYGRAAYTLQPLSARAADAYGVALAAAGDLDGARQLLDKAVRLAPNDPTVADHRRRLG
jgi:Flp pilus assembly protein TadD